MVTADIVVIGGGFYGTAIAAHLVRKHQIKNVLVIERECALLKRASYSNQARVHNGYHYPRSYITAYRSRVNYPKFIQEWGDSVRSDFVKLYAIARNNSKVTPSQFFRFCKEIGAPISDPPSSITRLFSERLVERVFLVEECAFDATRLADRMTSELAHLGVKVFTDAEVSGVSKGHTGEILIEWSVLGKIKEKLAAKVVFNCTYSGLNQFSGDFQALRTGLKHEITEMALITPPPELQQFGITVMDGAFFSAMPFPSQNLHTLSHVRYTPHTNWLDRNGLNPYLRLEGYSKESRAERMIRDVSRYLPVMRRAEYVNSMFEVKTVLVKNEIDDGRPILFEENYGVPHCYSVLGGKIDNIFDVLEKLDTLIPALKIGWKD